MEIKNLVESYENKLKAQSEMNNRINASQQHDLQQEHACLKERIIKELQKETELHIAA